MRNAKHKGLICLVEPRTEQDVVLALSGPFSLFRHTLLYGRALGNIIPYLAWCHRFELRAECVVHGRLSQLRLRSADPIFPSSPPKMFDSLVEKRFFRDFQKTARQWDVVREPEPVQAAGTLIFPDFALQHRGDPRRRWLLEIVGFWTPDYLQTKLERLREAGITNLVLCLSDKLNCSREEWPKGARVVRFGERIEPLDVLAVIGEWLGMQVLDVDPKWAKLARVALKLQPNQGNMRMLLSLRIEVLGACLMLAASTSLAGDPPRLSPQVAPELVENMLLGMAAGDAFGAGFEGHGREWIRKHVDFTRYVANKSGKWAVGHRLGDYSDDTADSIAVMRALSDPRPFTADLLLSHIRREYEKSRAVRGGAPRAGYGSIQDVFEGKKTIEQVRDYQRAKAYPGNAPPMRALPIGLLADEKKIDEYAVVNADVSHPHPKARAASVAIARAARYLLVEKRDPRGIIAYCRSHAGHFDAETAEYLEKVDRLGPHLTQKDYSLLLGPQPIESYIDGRPILGMRSDAMRTAGTVLYIVKYSKDANEALLCAAPSTWGETSTASPPSRWDS